MFSALKYLLFGKRTQNIGLEEVLISELQQLSNGLGEYANVNSISASIKSKGNELFIRLNQIEKQAKKIESSILFYWLAIAYKNYNAWYKRGDERSVVLEKVVNFLEYSIQLDNSNFSAKEELGCLLIEEKQIRDLRRGIKILELLRDTKKLSSFAEVVYNKGQRWNGHVEREKNDFSLIDPSPAFFREERKRYRAIVKEHKKEKNIRIETILKEFYNLAALYTMLYKSHDANSAVSGADYHRACESLKNISIKLDFSYPQNGRIENSSFFSQNDWKVFEQVYGFKR
jgi:hypothetical protein